MSIRVLFVCHGNICRSPMAEFIFKDMIEKKGLQDKFVIASSATSAEEIWGDIGNPVYPPARAELAKHGISCEGKRAVQFRKSDYEKYDCIVAMDSKNIRNIFSIIGTDPENKVHKLLEFAQSNRDVADPWYTGKFDITYRDIHEGCEALLNSLL